MALSGTFYGSTSNAYITPCIVWSASQSVTGNYSDVTATLKYSRNNTGYTTSGTWSGSITINGTKTSSSQYLQITYNSGTVAVSATVRVYHGTDGTKSITISGAGSISGTSLSSTSISSTVTLDTIPRASAIASANNVTVNGKNSCTVTITPKVSTYSHKVRWAIGSYSNETSISAGTTSASYVIPASWKNAFTSAKTGTCTVTVTTLSGSTTIGTSSKNITLSCDGSETPSFTLSASDANGYYDKIGAYLVSKSKIKADATGITYKYGASIKSCTFTIGTSNYTGTATSATAASNISAAGDITVKCVLTDTRGYTATQTVTITAYSYAAPQLTLSISRYKLTDEGTYEKDDEGDYGCVYYSATITEAGTNAVQSVVISYQSQDGTDPGGSITLTDSTATQYVACSTEKVYSFNVTLTDSLQSVVYQKQLSSAVTIMDILKGGKGVCFGGVATDSDTLDVRWKLEANGGTDLNGETNIESATITDASGRFHLGATHTTSQVTMASGANPNLAEIPGWETDEDRMIIVKVTLWASSGYDNGTGRRTIWLSTDASESGSWSKRIGPDWTKTEAPVNGMYTVVTLIGTLAKYSASRYINGYQNSGESLTAKVVVFTIPV